MDNEKIKELAYDMAIKQLYGAEIIRIIKKQQQIF